jgi:RNase P subunit RPR2
MRKIYYKLMAWMLRKKINRQKIKTGVIEIKNIRKLSDYLRLLRVQSTFCYCPKCNNELVENNSFMFDDDLVTFGCRNCGYISKWVFDNPVPILIEEEKVDEWR